MSVAQRTRFKHRFQARIACLLLNGFSRLSLASCHQAGAFLGWLTYFLPSRLRRNTITNVQLCMPQLSEQEQHQLVRRSLIETGKTLAEAGPLWLRDSDYIERQVKYVEGQELIQHATREQNGVIIAFPHLGAWEMLSLYCSQRYPMTTLYRKPRLQDMDEIVRHGRERFGARLVPADAGGVRALMESLKRGEVVGILPDQEPPQGKGVFAPFFGVPAYSMTLVSRLARKTGARVIIGYAQRLPQGEGFSLHFSKASDAIYDLSLEASVAALNKDVARCIREVPEQYQWSYKRFRTRPLGEQPVYT